MASLPATGPSHISLDNLDTVFDGSIKRPWTSPLYLAGTFVVAIAMILLPAIYIGLIGLVAYGVYYHATQDVWILSGGGMKGRLFVFVAPLVCGAVMIFFMIKPLLARAGGRQTTVSLVRANEPLLFAFVERICKLVGARPPSRINVDCRVNASAGLRDGLRGFFTGELTLTIGAPLAAGLTAQEFAGILAHEFGHFTQGVAMRLSYVIRYISYWFQRVVYERDQWDEKLDAAAKNNEGWISILLHLARFFVWLSRRILWVLMMIGHIVSCALMRQMEYNADKYSIRLVGGDTFERTSGKISMLSAASGAALGGVFEAFNDHKLADNLPELTLIMLARMPEDIRKGIENEDATRKTGLLDTHPSDAARIARARREQATGVFHVTSPASGLFRDFPMMSRELTFSFYRQLSSSIDRSWLVGTSQFKEQGDHAETISQAAERYYHKGLITARPLKIDRNSKTFSASPEQCAVHIKRARAALDKAGATVERVSDKYFETVRKEMLAKLAEVLIAAKLNIDPEEFDLKEATTADVERVVQEAHTEREAILPSVTKVEAVLTMRLEAAIALLESGALADKLKDPELNQRARALLDSLDCVHATRPTLQAMHPEQIGIGALARIISEENSTPELRAEANRVRDRIRSRLTEVHALMQSAPYACGPKPSDTSVADYVFGDSPRLQGDLLDIASLCESVMSRSAAHYSELMGELAIIGELVEEALGLTTQPASQPAQAD